jgi:hypothetical protein
MKTPEHSSGWLSRNAQRLAVCAVLGVSACTPAKKAEPQMTQKAHETVRIDDQRAIDLAKQAIEKKNQPNIVKGYRLAGVYRFGDDYWRNLFLKATQNRLYPMQQEKDVIVVYLAFDTEEREHEVAIALDGKTGEYLGY